MARHKSDDAVALIRSLIKEKRDETKFVGVSSAGGGGGGGGGAPFVNPLNGVGQLIVGGVAGALKRLLHPGVAGKVLTTTLTTVEWADGGAASGQYRFPVVVANDDGGFQIVNDGLGNPTYILQDLE